MNICIIPAKINSERVPNKNYKLFKNYIIFNKSLSYKRQSIIKMTIQNLYQIQETFDSVFLSVNDDYENMCIKHYDFDELIQNNNITYFRRNDRNAEEGKELIDVILEVLNANDIKKGICVIVLPTSILMDTADILKSIRMLRKNKFDCVFPVVENESYSEKDLIIKNNKVFYKNSKYSQISSKLCTKTYRHVSEFFTCRIESLLKTKKIITKNNGYILKESLFAQDIDTQEDWKIAEYKYFLKSLFIGI
jgi:N-acylneuraminate cytidylyltransferase